MRVSGTTIGFEGGAIPMTLVGSPDLVSSGARSGTYALRIDDTKEGAYRSFDAPCTELFARIAFKPSGTLMANYQASILGFGNSAGRTTLFVGLATNSLQLAAYLIDGGSRTLLGSGPTLIADTQYLIEVHLTQPHDTAGVFQVKLNGALIIDFEGDTLTPYDSTLDYASVRLGKPPDYVGVAQGLYDDLAVNDATGDRNNSWVGRGGIWPVYVTGAGDLAQFTPSAGANYECVDDVPPDDDTSYVSSDTEGHQDSYTITVPEVSGGVTAFTLWHYAKLDEAGAGNITQQLRKSSVDYDGDVKGLDTSYAYKSHTWETNPATGEPWTLADLETFYVGQETS